MRSAIALALALALACAWWLSSGACADALGFDFDEVLMICTALAAAGYAIAEWRRISRLDESALEICERIGALEAATGSHNPLTIAERVASIESAIETFDPVEIRERLATFEARIDHKPITQTRAKGGKFASPQTMQDEIDRLTAELARVRGGGS